MKGDIWDYFNKIILKDIVLMLCNAVLGSVLFDYPQIFRYVILKKSSINNRYNKFNKL